LPDKPPVIDSHRQADAAEWRISPTNGKAKLSGEPADFRGIRIFAMGAFTIEGIVAGVFVSGSHTFSKSERQSITLLPGVRH
jgi:hypothetical protein